MVGNQGQDTIACPLTNMENYDVFYREEIVAWKGIGGHFCAGNERSEKAIQPGRNEMHTDGCNLCGDSLGRLIVPKAAREFFDVELAANLERVKRIEKYVNPTARYLEADTLQTAKLQSVD